MITKQVNSEFGQYTQKFNHGHRVNTYYKCIDAYTDPEGEWLNCPCCGLRPKTWCFDNGRSTACGCGNSRYDHFSVYADSIMSVHTRCGGNLSEYDHDELRKHWNEYCTTMVNPCNHADLREDGKW